MAGTASRPAKGLFAADASSVSSGGTLPVRSLEPHLSAGADGGPAESLVLPGWDVMLQPGEKRALTLRLQIPCDRPVPGWRLEMVAYGPSGGQEVHVPWRDGMAGWREAVVKAACAG
ncbi:hypothetical protein ACQPYK_13400 [Streptosporangium sp. CA-135522]|uniref:hypothetical protein n=1 Tax=Streptosporangium sp. CA-135522 TaxID=3240072 RepID=UPI003D8B2ACC